jgi:hypothetical protein
MRWMDCEMTAVPFDTLKLARKLEPGGFTLDQANTAAEALAEAMSGAELATKSDIEALKSEFKSEIELAKRDLTIRLGGTAVVLAGIILGGMRLMLI